MMIFVNDSKRQFHIQNDHYSYVIEVLANGHLGHLYYGKTIAHHEDFSWLRQEPAEPVGNACFPFEGDSFFTLSRIKQEFPSYGTSDYRQPAMHILQENGSRIVDFCYKTHRLVQGKPILEGLPATFLEEGQGGQTLIITLEDAVTGLVLDLSYTVFDGLAALTRNARVVNGGKQGVILDRFLSGSVDLTDDRFDLIHLDGDWIRERHISRTPLRRGVQSIASNKGVSSSIHNPFMALVRPETSEDQGEAFGFNLVYSGNFLGQVEVDSLNHTRVQMGINPFDFQWTLEAGDTFQAPEVVMVYSDTGLNGMSQTFHDLYNNHLIRGPWKRKSRPVLMNNWEATYFDFDQDKLEAITNRAADLGVELFVLDDGWFKGRNDDTTSLGDWVVDRDKLPKGMAALADHVQSLGMDFGLWVEPEMVSANSDLFRAHPDWIIQVPDRDPIHGRNQYVLDMTRPEVRVAIFNMIAPVFREAKVAYVKWDMNRALTHVGSLALASDRQMETAHRYVLGVYDLMDRFVSAFPDVLFESCASGGNRFDPGMLYYMPQVWTSDNTDALERQYIQYGTSLAYPLSSMAAHVSDVPNHQTGRVTDIHVRFAVAYFGMLGYELDPTKLSDEECQLVREQIAFYKAHREIVTKGSFYRLLSPFEGNNTAWMSVSENGDQAVVGYYKTLMKPNPGYKRLQLKGLDPSATYQVEGTDHLLSGDALMHAGLSLRTEFLGTGITEKTLFFGDFGAQLIRLNKVK